MTPERYSGTEGALGGTRASQRASAMKFTRVADLAVSDSEIIWLQPRDFGRSVKVPRLSPAVSRQRRKARRAIVRGAGGTSLYSYSAQRYAYSYLMIAPEMERMLNPCRSTTSAHEYRVRSRSDRMPATFAGKQAAALDPRPSETVHAGTLVQSAKRYHCEHKPH